MFFVEMRFGENKAKAPDFMEGHKTWLRQGREDGLFLTAGSLEDGQGGAIVATHQTRADLDAWLAKDPFVMENVVEPKVTGFSPAISQDVLSSFIG